MTYLKHCLLLPVFTLLANSLSFSQVESTFITQGDLDSLKQSTLYVVTGILNSPEYDYQVESAMKNYWTFSEYEIIDSVNYVKMNSSTEYFFLTPVFFTYERYNGITLMESHDFIKLKITRSGGGTTVSQKFHTPGWVVGAASLLYGLGTQNKVYGSKTIIDEAREIVAVSDSSSGSLNDVSKVNKNGLNAFMIPLFVKNLQQQCESIQVNKMYKARSRLKDFNSHVDSIRSKKLFFLESQLNNKIKSAEDIKKYYKGEFEVISVDKYTELIKANDDVNVVNIITDNKQNYVQVFNVKSGTIYYYGRSVVHELYPPGILKYHLKKW